MATLPTVDLKRRRRYPTLMSPADLFLDLWDVALGNRPMISTADAPEWKVLHERLRYGMAPDISMAAAHIRSGLEFREKGASEAAHAHFRAAFAHAGPSSEACLHVAATLIQTGDLADAETVLRRAVAADIASAQIHVHLAHAVWGQGRQDEALRAICRVADDLPDDDAVAETAASFELFKGHPERAYDRAVSFLERPRPSGRPHPSVVRAVVSQAAIATKQDPDPATAAWIAAGAAAGDPIAVGLESLFSTRNTICAVWPKLLLDQAVDPADAEALRLSPDLKNVLRLERPSRVLALGSEEAASLYGAELLQPHALVQDGFALPPSAGVAARGFMTTDIVERRKLIESAQRLQVEILQRGDVRLHSPFGGVQESRSGTIINYAPDRRELGSVIAYFFTEPFPSFAFVLTEEHWPLAWYDPIEDVVLRHDGMPEFELYLQHRVVELKEVWLRLAREVTDYLNDRRRIMALYPAILEFLSTHLFAELQGISLLIKRSVLDRIDELICVSPEPLGAIEALFPECSGMIIRREFYSDAIALNEAVFRRRHLPVRVTGGIVDDELASRVSAHASTMVTQEWRSEIDRLRAACRPLMFVSLRSQSRKLLLSGAEIAAIFDRVASVYPKLGLIFDGYAVADRPIASAVLESEAALLSGILEHLSVPSLLSAGRSMSDSIYAATRCDLHLSEQGTSTTKAVLIANLPGVVIGPKQFGWDVRAFRDPSPHLLTPWDLAEDVLAGNIQTDYRLAPDVIVQSLLDVLRDLPLSLP